MFNPPSTPFDKFLGKSGNDHSPVFLQGGEAIVPHMHSFIMPTTVKSGKIQLRDRGSISRRDHFDLSPRDP